MTDKRSSIGTRARFGVAAISAVFVALVIGCGGSGGSSLSSSSSTVSTSSTATSATTATTTTTAGSTGSITNGSLPSNVILYGDAGSADVIGNNLENYDLYYVSPNGTGQALLVTVPASVSAAAANPNVAGQFVFASIPAGSSGSNYGIYTNTSLSTVNAKTIVAPTLSSVDAVTVTPDGNYIIYSAADANGNEAIFRVAVSGGAAVELYSGDDPEVDPTNSFITYDQPDPNNPTTLQYIWESKVDGTGAVQLTSGSFDEFPQFSKQSDRIVFDRADGPNAGARDIYTYTIKTKALTAITTSPDTQSGALFIDGASFGPDGSQVSFFSSPVNSGENPAPTALYVASSTPTTPSTVVAGSTSPATTVTSVVLPDGETYWTGSNGRSASPMRGFEFRRKHAIRGPKPKK